MAGRRSTRRSRAAWYRLPARTARRRRIEFRVLEDARDPPRMLKAARFAETLLIDPGVAATYSEAYLLPPVMSLHQFNRPGVTGTLLALAAKAVLNAPAPCAASRSTTSSVPAAGSRTEMVGSRSRMLICWRRLLRWRTRPGPARSGAPTAPMRWSTTRAGSTASATCAWWMPRSCRGFERKHQPADPDDSASRRGADPLRGVIVPVVRRRP